MKKLLVGFVVVALAAVTVAQDVSQLPGVRRRKNPEAFRQKVKEVTGGPVVKAGSGKGTIRFINAQKMVSADSLTLPPQQLGAVLRLDVKIVDGVATGIADVGAAIKASGASMGIVMLESDSLPTVLVAPENAWAIINVKALAADKKDAGVVANRLRREMYRAFGMLCGAAYTLDPNCAMQPVDSLADLDDAGNLLSPQAFPRITQYLKGLGVEPYVIKNYRDALREGWAPKPADKYQQKLWDDFHAEPTKGLKIKVNEQGKTVVK